MWAACCSAEAERSARAPTRALAAGVTGSGRRRVCGKQEALQALERAEHVRRALLKLPEHYRSVVVLRHYEGLRFHEIAEVLGIPEGTVKSRMFEGLSRLGVLLRDVQSTH